MSERSQVVPTPEGEYFERDRFAGLSFLLGLIAFVALTLCVVGAIGRINFSAPAIESFPTASSGINDVVSSFCRSKYRLATSLICCAVTFSWIVFSTLCMWAVYRREAAGDKKDDNTQ